MSRATAFSGFSTPIFYTAKNSGNQALASVAATLTVEMARGGKMGLLAMLLAAYAPRLVLPSGFQIQDVGASGWTTPLPTDLDTTTYSALDRRQPGTRLHYINPVSGRDPVLDAAIIDASHPAGELYFYKNGAIVDKNGLATNPANGLEYGKDPLNPNPAAIRPFRRYAYVAPREGATIDIGALPSPANRIGIAGSVAAFRAGFGDWFLIAGGTTLDFYTDLRTYLDDMGQSGTAIFSSNTLMGNGGSSAAHLGVVGGYGTPDNGRARVIHPTYAFIGHLGTGAYAHMLYTGIMLDGGPRDKPIRPVDWNAVLDNDAGLVSANFGGLTAAHTNLIFEDIHWHRCGGNVQFQWDKNHVTPTDGVTLNRYIITDTWEDSSGSPTRVGVATKTAGDQSWAAGTTTTVAFDNVTTGAPQLATSGVFTVPSGFNGSALGATYFVKVWALLDVTATVPTNGSIEAVVFVNGVEFATASKQGTGVTDDTYRFSPIFYPRGTVTGDTIDVRVRTTNASGTVTVLNNKAKLVISLRKPAHSGGVFMQMYAGTRWTMKSGIKMRNGFQEDPTTQATDLPAGPGVFPFTRYDWNILNHNMYTVGDADYDNVVYEDNVNMLGAAGEVSRNGGFYRKNYYYTGYVQMVPEHNNRVYTTQTGAWVDNVLQRYVALSGTTGAHPGWGLLLSSGTKDVEVKRNIVSDVRAPGKGAWAVSISSINTPYYKPLELKWVQDITGTQVTDNIFDSTDTYAGDAVLMECNGEGYLLSQWNAPITGSNTVGSTLTCTPTPGWASGTPAYQWYRYTKNADPGKVAISGATSQTYVAQDYDRNYLGVVGSAAAMTALSTAIVGDWCQRSDDGNKVYELTQLPITTAANWRVHTHTASGTRTYRGAVASDAAMTALSSAVVGDFCLRTDMAVFAELTSAGPASLANWRFIDQVTLPDLVTYSRLDIGYDRNTLGTTFHALACEVTGIQYPPGVGISGTQYLRNKIIKSPTRDTKKYYVSGTNGSTSPPQVVSTPAATSDINEPTVGPDKNLIYSVRADAQAVHGGSNWDADLASYLVSLGVDDVTGDGWMRYRSLTIGDDPQFTAMRRGKSWDQRLLGNEIDNHIRVGRGMAPI